LRHLIVIGEQGDLSLLGHPFPSLKRSLTTLSYILFTSFWWASVL
jgi:hypothetical protein